MHFIGETFLSDPSSDRSQHRVPAKLVCGDKKLGNAVRCNVRGLRKQKAKGAVFAPAKVTRSRRGESEVCWRKNPLQPR